MALTEFQRTICRLIARQRIESGESYVAGGIALNALTGASRVSSDIDLFHDTAEAVRSSWEADQKLLLSNGYDLRIERERADFVEAIVTKTKASVVVQWAPDSAFRFFPLIEHEDFGLTLHPFDLATNKVLALVGRLEPRDWIDVIQSHEKIQRLGYLAWAASGKDPGFNPSAILAEAGRSSRYSAAEINALDFEGAPPDASDLSRRWHAMLTEARALVSILPSDESGKAVLNDRGELFSGNREQLQTALSKGLVCFHEGRIRGAIPQFRTN